MKTSAKPISTFLSLAISSILMTACGGSSSSSESSSFTSKTVSGVAIDAELSGATVSLDNCDTTVTTNSSGVFTFNTTQACQKSTLSITGGTDTGTNLPFTGQLKIKSTDLQSAGSSLTVTPLTTLEAVLIDNNQSALLPTILTNLGISSTTNLSTYNYTTQGTVTTAARVFVLQQLINKITSALQASGVDSDDATDAAFSALASVLSSSTSVFSSNSSTVDETILTSIVTAAASNANTTISTDVASGIADSITLVSTAIDTAISSGSTTLATVLSSDSVKTVISENLTAASYSALTVSGYSLSELLASSSSPISIALSSLATTLNVGITLGDISSSTVLQDSAGLAFAIVGTRGSYTESLNVLVPEVDLTFSSTGAISSATIPAGTTITTTSTLTGATSLSFETEKAVTISSSGTISLNTLVNSNSTLLAYYNKYVALLRSGDNVKVTAYVQPSTYLISSALGLASSSFTINSTTLTGSTLTAYFVLS